MLGTVGKDTQEVTTLVPEGDMQLSFDATSVNLRERSPMPPVYTVIRVSNVLPARETNAYPGVLPDKNLQGHLHNSASGVSARCSVLHTTS